ncbi:MAG TPA: alpha-galactosidase, partial [Bacteroidota bacterium]|nr:alpha-galactosidase [Bacteroidota bacterium]
VRRSVGVRDSARAGHLLRILWGRDGMLAGDPAVVREGGFGQPAAVKFGDAAGAFFGLEYPASQNDLIRQGKSLRLRAGQEMGVKIDSLWCVGAPVVECITPDTSVRKWFWDYVNDIRVAPLRPYTLYNSWYDLRSPAFRNIPPGNVMNEANIMRIIGLIDRNMIEKHGIRLDAFVLDDGWDVYGSDWVLRTEEFPHGLKPIADELRKTGTGLGLWLGPTGGYSFHPQRMAWMKAHGYEVVDDQLCLAGTKYSALFRKRVEDFVRNDGVSFFKWDGIQFACNEPDHGHPVDIYSRRAVMESVIDKCNAVRKANPATYLNITSGTWLSPWWLQYANQIWMDGQDYGYADVPSISPRDAAITYRDFVLYDDLRTKDLWFPVANMMTHGIIKGNLEKLGGENEPLDKFTNEALLYFARGVSMWELYISPDILTEGEWDAMAQSMQWAKDRFPVLATTTMIGGDPKAKETYGYVHYRGEEGVIAARNPSIEPGQLTVPLSASLGLESGADSLVIERVYPSRWIMPRLCCAGSSVTLSIDRYETAVFEVYPLKNAARPLLAGVLFDPQGVRENVSRFTCYPLPGGTVRILNPASVASIRVSGRSVDPRRFAFSGNVRSARPPAHIAPPPLQSSVPGLRDGFEATLYVDSSSHNGMLAILFKPEGEQYDAHPPVGILVDGKAARPDIQSQKGKWAWYTVPVIPGKHSLILIDSTGRSAAQWKGMENVYFISDQSFPSEEVSVET